MAHFTAHKTAKNDFDAKLITASFLEVEASNGSYLAVSQDWNFKIANTRRGPNDSAFDKSIIDDVQLSHSDYVSNGASTSL